MVGWSGKLLALGFSSIPEGSSQEAKILEKEFEDVDYNGDNSYIWSEITNGAKGTRIKILSYMTGGPGRVLKKRPPRKTTSSASTNIVLPTSSTRRITDENNNNNKNQPTFQQYADNQPKNKTKTKITYQQDAEDNRQQQRQKPIDFSAVRGQPCQKQNKAKHIFLIFGFYFPSFLFLLRTPTERRGVTVSWG